MKIRLKEETIGCIHLEDGFVDITDPCYDKDVWCRMNNIQVQPGYWTCYAYSGNGAPYGNRVWACRIFSADPKHLRLRSLADVDAQGWEEIGDIGVDAGLAGFFSHKPDFNDDQWHDLCDWMHDKDVMHVSKKTGVNMDNCPVPMEGFWTSSGLGDGGYPVYAYRDEAGVIVGLEIRFR